MDYATVCPFAPTLTHNRECIGVCIDFWRAHDDGQSEHDLDQSDLILVGVSRTGKTSTALYLATHYGLRVASYPLTPEDFERRRLPRSLLAQDAARREAADGVGQPLGPWRAGLAP